MKQNFRTGKLTWLLLVASFVAGNAASLFAQTDAADKAAETDKNKIELSVGTEGVRIQVNQDSENDAPAITPGVPATATEDLDDKPKPRRRRRQHNPVIFHDQAEIPKVVIGREVVVKAGERVPGVVVINGSATIDGEVDEVMVCINSEAKINGKLHRELVSIISNVELGPQAEIDGETTVVGDQIIKAPGAKIHGQLTEVDLSGVIPTRAWINHNLIHGIFLRPLPPTVKWAWGFTLLAFALNFILALLLARPVQACAETLIARPIRSFFFGLLLLLLAIPITLLLIPTFIGPPLLVCSLVGALVLGRVVVYRAAGGQVGKQLGLPALELPLVAFLIGTAIFYLGYMIPFFGWVLWLIVMPLGAGAVVLSALGVFRREGQRPKSPPTMPAGVPTTAPTASTFAMEVSAAPLSASAPPAASGFATNPTEPSVASAAPPLLTPPPLAGGPSVASAELISLPRVGFWPRLGATFLDVVLVTICCVFSFDHGPLFFFLALIAYHVAMWTWKGTTLGGIILGLKVVRLDGRALDWPIALVRALAGCLSLMVFALGFFWASWSAERQSWHDIIAGTTIVKLPKTVPLI